MSEELTDQQGGRAIEPVVDGRFEIKSLLGEGGMGVVYEALHRDMERMVALKVLKSMAASPEQQARFKQEAQVICKLEHPNIVSIYSVGLSQSGAPYIAMEMLDGKPLAELINEAGPLPWRSAARLFVQACNAIEHAHSKGIIHRDIKPSNLVVIGDPSSADAQLKVVDFGIAKVLGSDSITRTNVIIGSAFYLSPGQCEGRAPDVHSDIYAMGCSLFEVLAGKPPFVADFYLETMSRHLSEEPPRVKDVNANADLPDDLENVIACCLRKDSAARYANTAALRDDLERVLSGTAPQNIPQSSPNQLSRATLGKRAQRVSWRTPAIVIGTAAVIGLGVCAVFQTVKGRGDGTGQVSSDVVRSQALATLDQQQLQVYALLHEQNPEAYRSAARVLLSASKTAQKLGELAQEAEIMETSAYDWRHLIDFGMRTKHSPAEARNEPLSRELELSAIASLGRVGESAAKSRASSHKRLHENCMNTAGNMAVGYYELNETGEASRLAERALKELVFLDVVRDRENCQDYQHMMQNLISPAMAHNQPELSIRLLKERMKWMKRAPWAASDMQDVLSQYEAQARQLGHIKAAAQIRAMVHEIK